MSTRPPKLDADALQKALGGRVPSSLSREGRIRLIGEVAEALLAERPPEREAALFVGSALRSWLEGGGRLERDCLQVLKARSKRTVARVWAEMHDLNSDGRESEEQQ